MWWTSGLCLQPVLATARCLSPTPIVKKESYISSKSLHLESQIPHTVQLTTYKKGLTWIGLLLGEKLFFAFDGWKMINERSPKWAGLCVAAYWAHPRLHKTLIYLYCTRDTPSEVFLQWRTWHVVCLRRRRTKAWSEWKHSIGIKGKQIFYMSYAIFVHVVFFFVAFLSF